MASRSYRVAPLGCDLRADFYRLHSDANGLGWCSCCAWEVSSWDGWGQRTAEANRVGREEFFARGESDGFLAYDGDEPAGWCQVVPLGRFPKLVAAYRLEPVPGDWAFTCFAVAPRHRGMGVATALVCAALDALLRRRPPATTIYAFPRRNTDDPWTGPESLFVKSGFTVHRDHPERPVLMKRLEERG